MGEVLALRTALNVVCDAGQKILFSAEGFPRALRPWLSTLACEAESDVFALGGGDGLSGTTDGLAASRRGGDCMDVKEPELDSACTVCCISVLRRGEQGTRPRTGGVC